MNDSVNFSPAVTQKASEVIYDQIRNMITNDKLQPGDKLPSERSLMEMLQRSRPTIREALRMLENAGLIRIVPGGGAIVQEPPASSVQQPLESLMAMHHVTNKELLEYRLVTEVTIAGWAAERRTDEMLSTMQKCIENSRKTVGISSAFLALDSDFHKLVAKASHNRFASIMEDVMQQMEFSALAEVAETLNEKDVLKMHTTILQEHSDIYNAIEQRDPEEAREAMRRHLTRFSIKD